MYVNIEIKQDKVAIMPQTAIAAGGKNYHIFKAVFSEDWDEFDKFAVFPTFNTSVAFNDDNEAVIPEACLVKYGVLPFGIYGRSGDGETHVSTNLYELKLLKGVGEGDAIIALPTDEDAVSAWTDYVENVMAAVIAARVAGCTWYVDTDTVVGKDGTEYGTLEDCMTDDWAGVWFYVQRSDGSTEGASFSDKYVIDGADGYITPGDYVIWTGARFAHIFAIDPLTEAISVSHQIWITNEDTGVEYVGNLVVKDGKPYLSYATAE